MAASWPALQYEELTWHPAASVFPRAGAATHPFTYRAAVPPHIGALQPNLDSRTTQLALEAEKELARFDAAQGGSIASSAPVLLRSEASSSSQIENLNASARFILSAELGAKRSRNAELIAGNTRALQAALELAGDFSSTSILEVHATLLASQPRHAPGQWRQEAVWIGTRSDSPAGADYVAPGHERVPELIEDLVRFGLRTDVPALVSVAITHAQFETIHPFTDGNGRTGRAIAQSMLRRHGVTRNVAVPVSAGLLADVRGYHAALTAYRNGEIAPMIDAFAHASLRAVANASRLVAEIQAIRKRWDDRLTARKNSNAWKLLDVIAQRPVLNSAAAAQALGVQQPNVYPPLNALVEAGILKNKTEHQLGPFWRNDEVLQAIDAFAARAGRRDRT